MQRRKKHGFLALLAVILIFMMTVPGTVPGALAASVPEAGESSIEGVTMNPESASETEPERKPEGTDQNGTAAETTGEKETETSIQPSAPADGEETAAQGATLSSERAAVDEPSEEPETIQETVAAPAKQAPEEDVPEPDWLLCDKLIVQAKLNHIEPVLVLNKADEADPSIREAFERDYGLFPRVVVSARTGEGLHALQDAIRGKICCFAGQSAVGKSSLMNALLPELDLPVGELTRKTDRGRHTTRHAQLWPCFGGALLDTPGFSLYEPDSFDEQLLLGCYPEFALADPCRFPGCMHRSEPGCGVKALLTDGRLSPARYERYVQIANDFTFRRKHQYD